MQSKGEVKTFLNKSLRRFVMNTVVPKKMGRTSSQKNTREIENLITFKHVDIV
jgi:hypothetical protein